MRATGIDRTEAQQLPATLGINSSPVSQGGCVACD